MHNCFFCGESEYSLLDTHRIFPGELGGTYDRRNTLVCCAGCHRKCTVGLIEIEGKFLRTDGLWVIHYWKEGQEFWQPELFADDVIQS